jgi:PAS domain S-box-containing protein
VDLAEDSIKKNWQLGNEGPWTIRGTQRRKDGTTFPVEVRADNFEYGGRRLRLNLVRDISERVQAERALKESEEKYRLLVNQIPAVVYQGYADCTIDLFDRKVEELTGYLKEEFDSRKLKWFNLILREDLSEARRIFIEALKGDRSYVREYRIRRKGGEIRSIQDRGHIYCDDAGKLSCIKGIFFDITDRQNAEKKLQESEQNLRHLASQLLHAQERERIRIAHELHDDLGQSLLLLKLQLSVMARGLPVELQKSRQECVASIDNVQDIIDSVRRLSHDLIPPTLSEIGLKSAINDLLEEFCRHHGLDYSLDMDDLKGLFSPDRELNIYRIVQESLTNIGKYAQATRISVSLKRIDHQVWFSVEDNGIGFEVDNILARKGRNRGLGLGSLQERSRMMGGTFQLWSKPKSGTKIQITVPLKKKALT